MMPGALPPPPPPATATVRFLFASPPPPAAPRTGVRGIGSFLMLSSDIRRAPSCCPLGTRQGIGHPAHGCKRYFVENDEAANRDEKRDMHHGREANRNRRTPAAMHQQK